MVQMKKLLCFFLIILTLFTLCACNKTEGDTSSQAVETQDETPAETQFETETVTETATETTVTETSPPSWENFSPVYEGDLLNHPNVLNVMLFGTDAAGSLSDSMILMSVDSVHGKIKLVSFQRDTYVHISSGFYHKLNYAYASGGAQNAVRVIENNYGIKIDRYASVNFRTFRDIIDLLGGVTLELTSDEIGYINGQLYENGQAKHHLDATAGTVTLNGTQALWHARNRGGTYGGVTYYGDDWDRTNRQREIICAILRQFRYSSYHEISQVIDTVSPLLTTDLCDVQMLEFIKNHAQDFLFYGVSHCAMPSSGYWSYGYNEAGSVILVNNWSAVREDLKAFIYEDLTFE